MCMFTDVKDSHMLHMHHCILHKVVNSTPIILRLFHFEIQLLPLILALPCLRGGQALTPAQR